MAILEHTNEYQAYKSANADLKTRVRAWPKHDEDLTSHIPKTADALKKLVSCGNELRELVEKTRGEEEVQKCMEELSEGMKKINTKLLTCLGALACTYSRLHGRTALGWGDIERMWPICSDNQVNGGDFKDAVERLRYNDYMDGMDRKELETVVDEIASTERCLHYLVGEGVYIKQKYAENGRTLADPNNEYHGDADDEEEKR